MLRGHTIVVSLLDTMIVSFLDDNIILSQLESHKNITKHLIQKNKTKKEQTIPNKKSFLSLQLHPLYSDSICMH